MHQAEVGARQHFAVLGLGAAGGHWEPLRCLIAVFLWANSMFYLAGWIGACIFR